MTKNDLSPFAMGDDFPGFNYDELIQAPLANPKVRFRNLAVEDDELRAKLLNQTAEQIMPKHVCIRDGMKFLT